MTEKRSLVPLVRRVRSPHGFEFQLPAELLRAAEEGRLRASEGSPLAEDLAGRLPPGWAIQNEAWRLAWRSAFVIARQVHEREVGHDWTQENIELAELIEQELDRAEDLRDRGEAGRLLYSRVRQALVHELPALLGDPPETEEEATRAEDGMLYADARFARYLEEQGDAGAEVADLARQDSEARMQSFRSPTLPGIEPEPAGRLWHLWLRPRSSGPMRNLAETGPWLHYLVRVLWRDRVERELRKAPALAKPLFDGLSPGVAVVIDARVLARLRHAAPALLSSPGALRFIADSAEAVLRQKTAGVQRPERLLYTGGITAFAEQYGLKVGEAKTLLDLGTGLRFGPDVPWLGGRGLWLWKELKRPAPGQPALLRITWEEDVFDAHGHFLVPVPDTERMPPASKRWKGPRERMWWLLHGALARPEYGRGGVELTPDDWAQLGEEAGLGPRGVRSFRKVLLDGPFLREVTPDRYQFDPTQKRQHELLLRSTEHRAIQSARGRKGARKRARRLTDGD